MLCGNIILQGNKLPGISCVDRNDFCKIWQKTYKRYLAVHFISHHFPMENPASLFCKKISDFRHLKVQSTVSIYRIGINCIRNRYSVPQYFLGELFSEYLYYGTLFLLKSAFCSFLQILRGCIKSHFNHKVIGSFTIPEYLA